MEQKIKQTISWGNGAGILLPKEWIGKQVKVVLIDRTEEIKKEIFSILNPYLEDIYGIYLTGSYARNEYTKESDIDIIVISNKTKKEIISGKYNVSIYPLESVRRTLRINPIMIYPRLLEAKPLLNGQLLRELLGIKISKNLWGKFISDTRKIVKINKEFIELDKFDGEYMESESVIYSIILRLRGMFIIKMILAKKPYSKKLFRKWLEEETKQDISDSYKIYESIRDDKKSGVKVKISTIEKFLILLEKEVSKIKE